MRVSASRMLLWCISCGVRRRLFRLSCVIFSFLSAFVLVAQMSDVVPREEYKCRACGANVESGFTNMFPCVYCGDTGLRTAIEILKEGRGYEFDWLDRSGIMRGYAREKRRHNPNKELLAEFFPLMKPYLGGKKEGKKPTSIGVPKTGVKPAKKAAANKPAKKAAKPAKKTAAK